MKDTNAIAREQQRRTAELAAEMREALPLRVRSNTGLGRW